MTIQSLGGNKFLWQKSKVRPWTAEMMWVGRGACGATWSFPGTQEKVEERTDSA